MAFDFDPAARTTELAAAAYFRLLVVEERCRGYASLA